MNLHDPKSPAWPIIYQVALIAATTLSCIILYKHGLVAQDGVLMLTNAGILYAVYLVKKRMTS